MKYCSQCGATLQDDATFCSNCGATQSPQMPLVQEQETQIIPTPPQIQYHMVRISNPTPQAWFQCRNCSSMIPLTRQVPVYNCPVCGESLTQSEKKPSMWTLGRTIAFVSILMAFIGEFLPFLSINFLGSTYSVQIWSEKFEASAILITLLLGCSVLPIILSRKSDGTAAFLAAIIILLIVYVDYTHNQGKLAEYDSGIGNMDFSGMLHPGAGFVLILIGCIGMIASCIVMHAEQKE